MTALPCPRMAGEGTGGNAPERPRPALGERVRAFLAKAQAEPSGLLGAGVALAISAIVSLAGWIPLSWPSQVVSGVLPDLRCTGFVPGSIPMYGCSAVVGALAVAGSVVIIVALFVLRRPIAVALRPLAARLPAEAGFLVAPAAGTLAFVVAWSGAHYQTADQSGLVPQMIFPCVVGLFLYSIQRWGDGLRRALGPLLNIRDRYAIGYRVLLAFAIPLIVSLAITAEARVSQTALKEQIVAIIALASGFVALVPRTGPLLAGIEGTLRELGAP